MESKITRNLMLVLLIALPMVSGCFGVKGTNPVADTSLSEATSNSLVQTASGTLSTVSTGAARYIPTTCSKKFSFAPPPNRIAHCLKQNCSTNPGKLRLKFLSLTKADHILITFENLKVKPEGGSTLRYSVPSTEIDLLEAADVSQLLADLSLPAGRYNYFEISIKKASVVLDGKTYPLFIPSRRIFFLGKFEIKDGFYTELTLKFSSRVIRFGKFFFKLFPVVKISSTLVPIATQETDGDISGIVLDYVTKSPITGVTATLSGGASDLTAVSNGEGKFEFLDVPAGEYSLRLNHADYLDKAFTAQVIAGQITQVDSEMNPAVIKSTYGNTGWFSENFPLSDVLGLYGECSMETPVTIDFVSLAFVKAEVSFFAEFKYDGMSTMKAFLSSQQQVQVINNLGGWWVGNNANLGLSLGDLFLPSNPGTQYTVDVTEYIRNNPSAAYYFAAMNTGIADIRVTNIQLSISYR